ncbi:putative ArsR family transcriptional regulator [Antricoccus suffuscus]|uniref:Putative ArsR family transcriptional regulator n=1 Tax=Antricoccus suffuscus TaxID=1629062 RepID=A0A2T1A6U8_9ACTN|nr:helix-turn-helix domain-containing protein [Antricoccus suffuscus]PRZ44335.1 putative ArsR family transcriptional regulator [Antricoccus suffuscus]
MKESNSEGSVDPVRAVSALDDPSRRKIYQYARDARRPISREQAAEAVGISRKLAIFHLDKLVEVGLLVTHYDAGNRVRKVGRTPKVYEPAAIDIAVTIPERQYGALAEILVQALVTERPGETARDAASRAAHERGRLFGESARSDLRGGKLGPERALTLAESALRGRGFEPYRESPACVRLANCPFHPLAERETEAVCGINYEFLRGFLSGAGASRVEAVQAPRPGECCVQLQAASG